MKSDLIDIPARLTSELAFCPHTENHVIRMTWVTSRALEDTGPMCMACAKTLNQQLQKFPPVIETLTIWPLPERVALDKGLV